jgi:hypothetical protein
MNPKTGWLAILLVLFASSEMARAANPTLDARIRGINDESHRSKTLQISDFDLRIDIVGSVAAATATMTFLNPGSSELEGDLSFQLPDGAVVSGYALDVGDTLIDGVLVEPEKAKRTYETQVRRGIDPGITRTTHANVFSTRIYPIRAGSSRTVRLRFVAPVSALAGWALPLETAKSVDRYSIALRAEGVASAPEVRFGDASAKWRSEGGAYLIELGGKRTRLAGELRIGPVRLEQAVVVTRHANGKRFFQISDAVNRAAKRASTGQRVRVYWDRSLSRRDDRLADELQLLDRYLAASRPESIEAVVFNSSGARVTRVADREELAAHLRGVLYRGATSFAVLQKADVAPADVCLVFSDGAVTIDARPDFKPGCRVFAISSAADADLAFLSRLATRADVLRVGRENTDALLARLTGSAATVTEIRDAHGRALEFALVDAGESSWAVVGEVPASGIVELHVAGIGRGIEKRRYDFRTATAHAFDGAGVLWAAARIGAYAAADDSHRALVATARAYSVANPALSFIVLEAPNDYVEAGIEPPMSYPAELLTQYRDLEKAHQANLRAETERRFDQVLAAWHRQLDWWNTSFDGKPKIAEKRAVRRMQGPMESPAPAMAFDRGAADSLSEVAVTGSRADAREMKAIAPGASSGRQISVELAAWNPDRPYLKALNAAAPGEFDRVLAKQEALHAHTPAFYFDVAEWLHRKQRVADALEMLLSALEFPVADNETLAMVADRLLRYGRADRAVWLLERVQRNADDLPQPRRALAIALEKRAAATPARARADLRRAMELLNEVIVSPTSNDYDGIELIALMDANKLLPKLRALGETRIPLDERLRRLLDVDIRVVIQWNTAATDMDLWVDEPTGERSYYGNQLTALGGRLSNDMTSGYGPEEYLLRRAQPGEYKIRVNVYRSDTINPNGSTVITAHLIRNYGRENEEASTMELELARGASGEQLVGKFTVN